MFTCPYCGAEVPDLANHYGGYRVEPCAPVLEWFGPRRSKRNVGHIVPMPADAFKRTTTRKRKCLVPGCNEARWKFGKCWDHRPRVVHGRKKPTASADTPPPAEASLASAIPEQSPRQSRRARKDSR